MRLSSAVLPAVLAFLPSLPVVGGSPPVPACPQASGAIDPAVRQRLRAFTGELARAGEGGLVERMRSLLESLGESEAELARAAHEWEEALGRSDPRKRARARKSLAARLRRELAALVPVLAETAEAERARLAEVLVALDSEQPEANALLGRTQSADGAWLTAEETRWRAGAEEVENLVHGAESLAIEIETGSSTNPLLERVAGGGSFARAHGIELHGRLPPERLERILRQALRACALSRGLLLDDMTLPRAFHARTVLLLDTHALWLAALEASHAAGALSDHDLDETRTQGWRSYVDGRGWRVDEPESEAGMSAILLWSLLPEWFGSTSQPCLRVGHLNWVCQRFLCTPMPLIAWAESGGDERGGERSVSRRADPLPRWAQWRCARRSLWGSHAWMRAEVRARRDPPWARAMLDEDGKIRDANLLKTTLVCELLQQEGGLADLVVATRSRPCTPATFEAALGAPLPALEARWRRWLDPARASGILQELEGASAPAPGARDGAAEGPFDAALLALNHARADALLGQAPEIPVVALDPDLCNAAAQHARYLSRNPEQIRAWPQMHEEYRGSPGFTPEGALSGASSIIALGQDPLAAVRTWLGTFYHRLPLLDPGLVAVGFGVSADVVVLDAGSLRLEPYRDHVVLWPLPDAEDVPLACTPELPSPVPGADLAHLGYPVSVQLSALDGRRWTDLSLELFLGAPEDGHPVEGHFVGPGAPLQPELVPTNAFGFLARTPLARRTRYTARARWGDEERVWSFRTGP